MDKANTNRVTRRDDTPGSFKVSYYITIKNNAMYDPKDQEAEATNPANVEAAAEATQEGTTEPAAEEMGITEPAAAETGTAEGE